MKKFITTIFLMFLAMPAFCSNWQEIFKNQEIDFESIQYNSKTGIIKFFVKKYKDNPTDKFNGQDYDYIISLWAYNCTTKQQRIELFNVYDNYNKVLYGDEYIPEWSTIIPDTYADGYYRLFCLVPFKENPLLKK